MNTPRHSQLTLAAHALDLASPKYGPEGQADLAEVANWLQDLAREMEHSAAAEKVIAETVKAMEGASPFDRVLREMGEQARARTLTARLDQRRRKRKARQ